MKTSQELLLRVKEIEYKNKTILSIDLSCLEPEEILIVVEESKRIIAQKPLNSLLTFTNVTNLVFNKDNLDAFKDWTKHNRPYVKAAAIVGLQGMLRVGYIFVMAVSKRVIYETNNETEALDWLANQA